MLLGLAPELLEQGLELGPDSSLSSCLLSSAAIAASITLASLSPLFDAQIGERITSRTIAVREPAVLARLLLSPG